LRAGEDEGTQIGAQHRACSAGRNGLSMPYQHGLCTLALLLNLHPYRSNHCHTVAARPGVISKGLK